MNYKKIIERLEYWKKRDDEFQKAFSNLFKKISPDYPPYIEHSIVQGFIDGVAINKPELKHELEYYAYEMQDDFTIEHNGKKYTKKDYHVYLGSI